MSKILVADDSPQLLEAFKLLLEKAGHEVRTALYKYSLMTAVKEFKPDVILMDVFLRANSGKEICKELKNASETRDVGIILMSSSPCELEDYQKCQADDILEKPLSMRQVFSKLRSVLKVHNFRVICRPVFEDIRKLEMGYN